MQKNLSFVKTTNNKTMKNINIRFDSAEGVQQITLKSIEDIDNLLETLQDEKKCLFAEPEETEKDIEVSDLSSYCMLNADGIVMAKIIADKYDQDEAGKFHLFYEKGKIVAVAPASWTVVREENFDEES